MRRARKGDVCLGREVSEAGEWEEVRRVNDLGEESGLGEGRWTRKGVGKM